MIVIPVLMRLRLEVQEFQAYLWLFEEFKTSTGLHRKFKDSLSNIMRPFLTITTERDRKERDISLFKLGKLVQKRYFS